CSRNKYSHLTNFQWYTGVLMDLSRVEGTKHGGLVAEQLIDVALRVEDVRGYTVQRMLAVLQDKDLIMVGHPFPASVHEVLRAAAWIVGEY
ncbi:unnamed protein product, partial [Discosporangium mesarthrocarpum]